jgi:small conductance mechanosensitive channel
MEWLRSQGFSGETVEQLGADAVRFLPRAVLAVVLLIVFWLLARGVRRWTRRALESVSTDRPINTLLSGFLAVLVMLLGAFGALTVLEFGVAALSVVLVIGVVIVALSFAFQDIASNFIAGVLMTFLQPYKQGDVIETAGFHGIVQEIRLRDTVLTTQRGTTVLVPNKLVFQTPLVHFSAIGKRRVSVDIPVPRSVDLAVVEDVAGKSVAALPDRDTAREIEVYFLDVSTGSLTVRVDFWVDYRQEADVDRARSDAIYRLLRAFDGAGIPLAASQDRA